MGFVSERDSFFNSRGFKKYRRADGLPVWDFSEARYLKGSIEVIIYRHEMRDEIVVKHYRGSKCEEHILYHQDNESLMDYIDEITNKKGGEI